MFVYLFSQSNFPNLIKILFVMFLQLTQIYEFHILKLLVTTNGYSELEVRCDKKRIVKMFVVTNL